MCKYAGSDVIDLGNKPQVGRQEEAGGGGRRRRRQEDDFCRSSFFTKSRNHEGSASTLTLAAQDNWQRKTTQGH